MTKDEVIAIISATAEAFAPGSDPSALLSIAKRESAFNPTAMGDSGTSYGLYQLKPQYMLKLWNSSASPTILLDPRVATVIAMRLWNRAVRLGASNPIEVRLVWAFGPKGLQHKPGSEQYEKRRATERARFASLGYPAGWAERSVVTFGYGPAGTDPTSSQDAQLSSLLGNSSGSQMTEQASSIGLPLLVAVVMFGGLAIWKTKK